MNAELLSVQIDGCVSRDAIKLQAYALALPTRRSRKRLSVPANTGGIVSSPRSGGILLIWNSFDTPVVRNRQRPPRIVVELGRSGIGRISHNELPVRVR